MSKEVIRKEAKYVVSMWTVDAHHRIYLVDYNIDDCTARWSKDYKDAFYFTNPIVARNVVNYIGIKDAEIFMRPIEIEEEIKEMNSTTSYIIQTNIEIRNTYINMFVWTASNTNLSRVKFTKYADKAKVFSSLDDAEFFIHKYQIKNARIISYNNKKDLNMVYAKSNDILPSIKNVIFNAPATIVFWDDGTKTVVKCQEDDIYDPEKGLAMAITKKALGNNYEYYNTIKHWIEKAPKAETSTFYCNGVTYSRTTAKEDK